MQHGKQRSINRILILIMYIYLQKSLLSREYRLEKWKIPVKTDEEVNVNLYWHHVKNPLSVQLPRIHCTSSV